MKTLNVSISDFDSNKFGIKGEEILFTDLIDLIQRQLMRQSLDRCVELAEKHGLSNMTMDEIDEIVKEVRDHAKNNN